MLGLDGAGVFLNWGDPIRICNGHGRWVMGTKVWRNVIADCGRGYVMPTEHNEADGNVLGAAVSARNTASASSATTRFTSVLTCALRAASTAGSRTAACATSTTTFASDCMEADHALYGGRRHAGAGVRPDAAGAADLSPVFDFLSARDCTAYEEPIRVNKRYFKK